MTRLTLVTFLGFCLALAITGCGSDSLHVAGVAGSGGVGGASLDAAGSAGADAGDAGQVGMALDLSSVLGLPCASDQDCAGPGLLCVRANHDFGSGIGAPPGGVCTAKCQVESDCEKLAPGAVCAALSEAPLDLNVPDDPAEPRYCMAGCSLGAPAGATKCHGRDAFACRPFALPDAQKCAAQTPFCPDGGVCFRGYCRELACGPRCESDTDCESGRYCDPSSGLCVQAPVAKTPIGAPCDPDAATTPCENGRCLVMFDENNIKTGSFCTQSCVIGEVCAGGQGACQLPRFSDYEVGDIGYCQATCKCNGDCQVPGDSCLSWGDPELESFFSSAGSCDHVSDPAAETVACSGDGGSTGDGGSAGAP